MKKFHIFLLLLIIAIAIGFRIYKLGGHDLWHDEVVGVVLHQYSWQFITRITQAPLHMIFVMYLTKLTDRGEFWVRLPAMIFGCASIILIYIFGKLLFNSQVGLIGAFFLSISPFHIWYSQEAGRYTLAVFFMILTSYFFIRCLKESKTWLWVSFSFIQVAGLYTSYLFSLIILPQMIIIVLFERGRHMKRWLLSCCVVFLLFLPWLKVFISHVESIYENFWIPETTPFSLLYITLCNFNLGYTVTPAIFFISSILWSAILIFALWNGLKKYRDSLIITALFLIVPIMSVFFMSQWKPIYISRQMSMFLPFYLLLVGLGVQSMRRKIFKTMSIVILFSLTSFSLINYYHDRMPAPDSYHVGTYIKKPFSPIVEYVKRNFKHGDIVAYTNPSLCFPFWYYWGSKGYKGFYFIISEAQDAYWRNIYVRVKKTKGIGSSSIVDMSKGLTLPCSRIWIISSSWSRDGSLCSNSKAVLDWMKTHYTLLFEKWMDGILISLYEKK